MNEQEKQDLTEEIATRLVTHGHIRNLLSFLPEEDIAILAEKTSPYMWSNIPTNALRKIKRAAPIRVMVDGDDVDVDDNGVGVGHAGPTLPDIVNFIGATGYLTTGDGRQVNIRAGGSGADCMFDYLVSSCFATDLPNFTEG